MLIVLRGIATLVSASFRFWAFYVVSSFCEAVID